MIHSFGFNSFIRRWTLECVCLIAHRALSFSCRKFSSPCVRCEFYICSAKRPSAPHAPRPTPKLRLGLISFCQQSAGLLCARVSHPANNDLIYIDPPPTCHLHCMALPTRLQCYCFCYYTPFAQYTNTNPSPPPLSYAIHRIHTNTIAMCVCVCVTKAQPKPLHGYCGVAVLRYCGWALRGARGCGRNGNMYTA